MFQRVWHVHLDTSSSLVATTFWITCTVVINMTIGPKLSAENSRFFKRNKNMKKYIEYFQVMFENEWLNSQPQSLFSNTTASVYCYRASSAVFHRLLFLHCVHDAIYQGHDCVFNYVLNFIYYKVLRTVGRNTIPLYARSCDHNTVSHLSKSVPFNLTSVCWTPKDLGNL